MMKYGAAGRLRRGGREGHLSQLVYHHQIILVYGLLVEEIPNLSLARYFLAAS